MRVRLLGKFAVTTSEREPVAIAAKKHKALLAYLCVNAGKAQTRERLADLLWGSSFEEQARQSLRQAITKLRNSLGDETKNLLRVDADTLMVNADAVHVDVLQFEELSANNAPDALEKENSVR